MNDSSFDPNALSLEIRSSIRVPLSRYLQALEEAFRLSPDPRLYAHIRHGVTEVLQNTLRIMPTVLLPESSSVQNLGLDKMLRITAYRLRLPLEFVRLPVPEIPKEIKDDLIVALESSAKKVQDLAAKASLEKTSGFIR